ncbi:MAG: methylmalonyl-CoA carboxyltransferase [Candidatus Cloacimonetes bacterium 4572_55]|nr:MAG: methylmalonyl-CoA carboxyltransferase [Candidatus Cloacimonetes bacterium 4572_55]
MSTKEKIEELRRRRKELFKCGGERAVEKQHKAGKFTTRERVGMLFDPGTFSEMFPFATHRSTNFGMDKKNLPADGVVTGVGMVTGRETFVASQDFTIAGGSVGEIHADKICQIMDQALKCGSPFVFINDSGGARIQEGIDSLAGYGRIFYRNVLLSGVVPQISIIAGPCAGGAAYSPALTDFIIMIKGTGKLFVTGPQVIKQVTGEDISSEDLGGVYAQMARSGVIHFIAENELDAINTCKRLLDFLPPNNTEPPPDYSGEELEISPDPALNKIIPDNPKEPYDMREVIARLVDNRDFLEIQDHFAPNVLIGFSRMNGRTIGLVANQPNVMAGALDINASDKVSRFVRFCNAFNISIVTLVDVPGFLPGIQQEYGGIIRHGAKMLFTYSAATVPKVSIILRKAYGGAYLAMCAKDLGCDRVAAWPTGQIAVMGAKGAVEILYRRDIKKSKNPEADRAKYLKEYEAQFYNPYAGAARNMIDDIIEPKDTRRYLSLALELLQNKRELRPAKKHGLIPL